MRYPGLLAATALALLATVPAMASTEVNGKVVHKEGKPVANASVRLTNKKSTNLDYTVTSDKNGMYFIPNVFFQEAAKDWSITCGAPGLTVAHVKVVARTAQRAIYYQIDKDVTTNPEIPARVEALAEIKVDFTLGPPAAVAPDVGGEAVG